MRRFGLIGKKLGHSFSPSFFTTKFLEGGLSDCSYETFELEDISEIDALFRLDIEGLNVTIPYKSAVIPFLHGLDEAASDIGAVNCIVKRGMRYIGYNTDWLGFKQSVREFIGEIQPTALILGNGGSSKAVQYALRKMDIPYLVVARTGGHLTFEELDTAIISTNQLIINTTPLGMHPQIAQKPPIPYDLLGDQHFLFDLIYNPEKTLFLTLGNKAGAKIQNGLPMLIYQAEASWALWNQ